MLVTVTNTKAPWPAGAAVGSVVALPHDAMPAWAVGKCVPSEEGAEAQFTWEPPADPAPLSLAPPVGGSAAAADPDALASLQALLDAERQAAAELGTLLEAERAKVATLTGERDAALADVEKLKADAKPAANTKAGKAS